MCGCDDMLLHEEQPRSVPWQCAPGDWPYMVKDRRDIRRHIELVERGSLALNGAQQHLGGARSFHQLRNPLVADIPSDMTLTVDRCDVRRTPDDLVCLDDVRRRRVFFF